MERGIKKGPLYHTCFGDPPLLGPVDLDARALSGIAPVTPLREGRGGVVVKEGGKEVVVKGGALFCDLLLLFVVVVVVLLG